MNLQFSDDSAVNNREMMDRQLMGLNTCLPGKIVSFDEMEQTCSVIPAIQVRVYRNGVPTDENLPQLSHVPVYFPFSPGAGFAVTTPVNPGDPCLLIFSQRCIDNWHNRGGIQPPEQGTASVRHHDLVDAFALVCAPPIPATLPSWCSNGVELRNVARDMRVTVTAETASLVAGASSMTLAKDGQLVVDAPTVFNQVVRFNAPVTTNSTMTDINGVELQNHKHPISGGNTGTAVAP